MGGAVVEGDRYEDRRNGDEARDRHGDVCTHPPRRPGGLRHPRDRVEDRRCRHRPQEVVGGVERDLQPTLLPVEGKGGRRPDDLRGDELDRRGEEEPKHERDLAEREPVLVAPEADADDRRLGYVEQEREPPPRDAHRGLESLEPGDVEPEHPYADREQEGGEQPYRRFPGRRRKGRPVTRAALTSHRPYVPLL